MPELPEVETIKKDLEKVIIGLTIKEIQIYDKRIIGSPRFSNLILKKKIEAISRRGKVIIIQLSGGLYWIIHLKMTGQLIYGENLREKENLKETKLVLKLSNGKHLNYNDQRLFGRHWIVRDPKEIDLIKNLGPEPLNGSFTVSWLKDNLKSRGSPIKIVLMDQHFVAGIGNIYASEILFKAGIDPQKRANRIKAQYVPQLYQATRDILNEAITYRGSSMRNYRDSQGQKGKFMDRIKVYAKENEPCPACKSPIKKIVQGQRSTFYCKQCQR
jgi:formamidopyrimidine-DNA glycosylase